jgi:glycosyltransferase involved in cell wall biosynthesis
MKIAMLGTRGVPASYSGFETCVEELGSRLAQRGHQVTVYCRSHHISYDQPVYRGMRLVKLPTIANKYLDTIVHSLLSSLHALTQWYDVALYFIAGNSLVTWIPRLAGQRSLLNVDGLDWKRAKWPPLAKRYIQFAERMSTVLPNAIITDSRVVQRYYREVYGADSVYIAYGSDLPRRPPGPTLARFGLTPRDYVLFVGRLVPENCAHHLVEAMHSGNCVVVHNTPENLETIGGAGLWYDGQAGAQSLTPVLRTLLDAPPLVDLYRQAAAARATAVYSWEGVTDAYEALFKQILRA